MNRFGDLGVLLLCLDSSRDVVWIDSLPVGFTGTFGFCLLLDIPRCFQCPGLAADLVIEPTQPERSNPRLGVICLEDLIDVFFHLPRWESSGNELGIKGNVFILCGSFCFLDWHVYLCVLQRAGSLLFLFLRLFYSVISMMFVFHLSRKDRHANLRGSS